MCDEGLPISDLLFFLFYSTLTFFPSPQSKLIHNQTEHNQNNTSKNTVLQIQNYNTKIKSRQLKRRNAMKEKEEIQHRMGVYCAPGTKTSLPGTTPTFKSSIYTNCAQISETELQIWPHCSVICCVSCMLHPLWIYWI